MPRKGSFRNLFSQVFKRKNKRLGASDLTKLLNRRGNFFSVLERGNYFEVQVRHPDAGGTVFFYKVFPDNPAHERVKFSSAGGIGGTFDDGHFRKRFKMEIENALSAN